MARIAVIDSAICNLRSVERALATTGATAQVTGRAEDIESADAIILPGVGAFESGMKHIAHLKDTIVSRVEGSDVPLLGICLGMQMLFEESDEGGNIRGLGLLPGRVEKFSGDLKVPHMGWNSLSIKKPHPIMNGIDDGSYVYFVHSYRANVSPYTVAASDYGGEFTAIVANNRYNVVGTQFHPEKSGDAGLKMLKNFVEMI